MIKIAKTFKIPKVVPGKSKDIQRHHTGIVGKPRKYPFVEMRLGESFSIPREKVAYGTVSNILRYWNNKFTDRKFSYRTMNYEYRIWRIK